MVASYDLASFPGAHWLSQGCQTVAPPGPVTTNRRQRVKKSYLRTHRLRQLDPGLEPATIQLHDEVPTPESPHLNKSNVLIKWFRISFVNVNIELMNWTDLILPWDWIIWSNSLHDQPLPSRISWTWNFLVFTLLSCHPFLQHKNRPWLRFNFTAI